MSERSPRVTFLAGALLVVIGFNLVMMWLLEVPPVSFPVGLIELR